MIPLFVQFIRTNDRIVSLKSVSNINILDKRIVFNLNYSIEIENRGYFKYISDYVYWDFVNDVDFNNALKIVESNAYVKERFIAHKSGYINTDEISSIKLSDKKRRVIFNLSHPITYVDRSNESKITSEFVYVDFDSTEEYNNYVKYINEFIF